MRRTTGGCRWGWLGLFVAAGWVACAPAPGDRARATPDRSDLSKVRAAILRAEDRRLVDEALESAMTHPDSTVRAQAVRALGRIGDPASRERVSAARTDRDPDVRAESAFAAGLFDDEHSLAELDRLVADRSPVVRISAAHALGRIGDPGANDALARLFRDDDTEVVAAAALAAAARLEGSSLVDPLIEVSRRRDQAVALAATYALSHLAGTSGRLTLPAKQRTRERLLELADAGLPLARAYVALGLRVPIGTAQIETLADLVEDPTPAVRVAAVFAVSFPGAPLDPFLSKTMRDEDPTVVLATLQGLARLRGAFVAEALAQFIVNDPRDGLRLEAARSLGEVDPDRAAQMARGLARAKTASIRGAAAALLRPELDDLDEILEPLLADAVPAVRHAAIPAAAWLDAPLSTILEPIWNADSTAFLESAARAARRRLELDDREPADREDTVDVLERLWEASEGGGLDARLAVVEAAGAAAPLARGRALCERATSAERYEVRVEAIAQLEARYGATPGRRATPATDLPLEHYERIVTWAERPRAAVVTVVRPGFAPGRFSIALEPAVAPLAAWRFAQWAAADAYNGTEIVRLTPYVRWLSEPPGAREGRAEPTLRPELYRGGFWPGTLAMRTTPGRDSANGSWLVTLGPMPHLAYRHTAFGRVVRNFAGVAALLQPEDRIQRIEVYEGDGTEPLR